MKIVDKLKLNRFREVAIPKNSDFFARLQGNLQEPADGFYSGEESLPSGLSKIEELQRAEKVLRNDLRRKAAEDRDAAQREQEANQ